MTTGIGNRERSATGSVLPVPLRQCAVGWLSGTLHRQIDELTPAPIRTEVTTMAATATRWLSRWQQLGSDRERLPAWVAGRFDELLEGVQSLPNQLPPITLCHFDIRDDDLLIQGDDAVIVDWGMARLGPPWIDLALLALQQSSATEADRWLRTWIGADQQQVVTALVLASAVSQTWNALQPPKRCLPGFAGFCAADAQRLFEVAALRL